MQYVIYLKELVKWLQFLKQSVKFRVKDENIRLV